MTGLILYVLVVFQGGGTVRLYHKEMESYIVAKGSFAGVFASLDEIRKVHEMHPDFRTSLAHQAGDPGLVAASIPPNYERVAVNSRVGDSSRRGTLQVQADVEPIDALRGSSLVHNPHRKTRDSLKFIPPPFHGGLTGEATLGEDVLSHRKVSRGGLDYYDTGTDFESRGVVDENGK